MIIQNGNTCKCIVPKIKPMCSKSLLCASSGQNCNHHMLSYKNELQVRKITKEILLCMLLYSFISGNIDFYAINEERRKCRYSKMYFGSQCVKGKIQGLMRYHLRGLRSVLYDQYCAISNVSGHILPAKMPFSLFVCSSLFCYGCVHTIQVATIRITQLIDLVLFSYNIRNV